jgi:HEAT repeat protein
MGPHFRILLGGLLLAGTLIAVPRLSAAPEENEAILKKADVATTGPGLLEFFRKRTLTGDAKERITKLVGQLGDNSYKVRRQTSKELVAYGASSLPALRRALKESQEKVRQHGTGDTELELQERAAKCIHILVTDPGPALPLAALRVLRDRKPDGACPVLLGYVPFVDNRDVEEELLESLQALGVKDGKANRDLLAALKDKTPARRAAAAFVVGRIGDLNQRPAVRQLLEDPEPSVRLRAGQGIIGKEMFDAAAQSAAEDEKLLRGQKIAPDEAGLLAFIQKRTLTPADQDRLRRLVSELGSKTYRVRRKASAELPQYGSAALPYLRPALQNPDVEIKERAARCIAKIESGPATALPAAVVRLLTLRAPAKALKPLLAYSPFVDDQSVEEEVRNALCVLNLRAVKLDPALPAALQDKAPARRAAAVFAIGRVGTSADYRPLRKMLADSDPEVRFHAAHVLLTTRDRAAIPVLVAALTEGPLPLAARAEELLTTINGKPVTELKLSERTSDRRKVRAAWTSWWKTNETKIDLARITFDTERARAARATEVSLDCVHALVRFDKAAFKKTLAYPFYMEGMARTDDGLIRSSQQIDDLFKLIEQGGAQVREEMKQLSFKVRRVGRLDEFLKIPADTAMGFRQEMRKREDAFLKKFRKGEVLVVHIAIEHKTRKHAENGVLFVRLIAGRPAVIGLAQDRSDQGRMMKKKK